MFKSRYTKRYLNSNKFKLLSLSADLSRVKSGILSKSDGMVNTFTIEALKWIPQIKTRDKEIIKILDKVQAMLNSPNSLQKAEDCLMYSVLLQNRAMKI